MMTTSAPKFARHFTDAPRSPMRPQLGAKSGGWISAAGGPAFGAIGHVALDMSVASLVLFVLLVTGDVGWEAVRRWLPFSEKGTDELKRAFTDTTRATAVGGLSTLIPVVGNAIVWVPAVIAQLARREYMAALLMVVFGKLIPALLDQGVRATPVQRPRSSCYAARLSVMPCLPVVARRASGVTRCRRVVA